MNMLFQHLLFISLNIYHTKVYMQHREYIIIYNMFTVYQHWYNVFGHRKTNVEALRHTLQEDTPVKITKYCI